MDKRCTSHGSILIKHLSLEHVQRGPTQKFKAKATIGCDANRDGWLLDMYLWSYVLVLDVLWQLYRARSCRCISAPCGTVLRSDLVLSWAELVFCVDSLSQSSRLSVISLRTTGSNMHTITKWCRC